MRPSTRLFLAALLALCLGVRLLTPEGFMPSFAHGSLAIVPCPDADGAIAQASMPSMSGMAMSAAHPINGHDRDGSHRVCPYAAVASVVGIDAGAAVVAFLPFIAGLRPLTRALPAIRRHATRDRPPAQGPPLPA